jgi:hypothetical protein
MKIYFAFVALPTVAKCVWKKALCTDIVQTGEEC